MMTKGLSRPETEVHRRVSHAADEVQAIGVDRKPVDGWDGLWSPAASDAAYASGRNNPKVTWLPEGENPTVTRPSELVRSPGT